MAFFDKNKSKIKLWVGVAFKNTQVYYSRLSQDKKSEDAIIKQMTKDILTKKHQGQFTEAIFYENSTNKALKTVKGNFFKNEDAFLKVDKGTAKVKLWIGFPDNIKNLTFYNINAINNLDNTEIIEIMENYILNKKFNYQFVKALFFNVATGMIVKEIEGKMMEY